MIRINRLFPVKYAASKAFFGCLFCLISLSAQLSAQVKPVWKKDFKNSLNTINKAVALRIDPEGNCYVLGFSWMPDSAKDIVLVKYSAEGNEIWRRMYDNPSHGDDISTGLALDAQGNIWVSGTAHTSANNADFLVTRFTPTGINDVNYIYDGDNHLFDMASCIAVAKNGNVYAAGYTTSADSGLDAMVICLNHDGSPLWKDVYKSLTLDMYSSLCTDDSSNVYLAGTTNGAQRNSDILIRKFNAHGELKWNRVYDGVFGERDAASLISIDDSANVYISGFSNHTSDRSDIPVLKYNRNGLLQKEILYNGKIADCFANSVSVSKNEIVLVGSSIDYTTTERQTFLLRYNKGGKEKLFLKAPEDVTYYWYEDLGKQTLVLGAMLTHPESTLMPYIGLVDTLPKCVWTFKDSTVYGIAHMIDAKSHGHSVYFLGDDAGDATGTITLMKYEVIAEADKKNTQQKNHTGGVQKNQRSHN